MTHADRQARYRTRQAAAHTALVRELAQAKAQIARLQAELADPSRHVTPPVEKPRAQPAQPASPDIEKLKAKNRELRARLQELTRLQSEMLLRVGKMPPATFRAVVRCLHPDHVPSEAERSAACQLLNDWRTASRKG